MVLSTEWSQVEVIELINDGNSGSSGLGFGIVGGRSTGVVVKSILPGGAADRDGRLQSGDHVLQIGEVSARGLACEHVATVLRASGTQVRLIVARPVESITNTVVSNTATIVPTQALSDPEELELLLMQNGETYQDDQEDSEPEVETEIVELEKNAYGLGITVAGYVWEREDLSGIFVKGISEGSAAALSGRVRLNDRIVAVDGTSLLGVNNHEAVEILKRTGPKVTVSLERYLRGPRYEHLQNALRAEDSPPKHSPPSPSATTLSWFPADTECEIEPEPESHTTIDSMPPDPETIEVFVDAHFESGVVTPDIDEAVKRKWENIVGPDTEIIIAQLKKTRGLGISLEGTVDVEDGVELRPRHFIRSILPEGPVGISNKLISGDELLEVNGQKLLGRNHVEVVKILRELPEAVRLVCARGEPKKSRVIDTSQDRKAFEARNILGGSLGTLLANPENHVINVQSDGSLHTSSTVTLAEDASVSVASDKSREILPLQCVHYDLDEIFVVCGSSNINENIPNGCDISDEGSILELTSDEVLIHVNDKELQVDNERTAQNQELCVLMNTDDVINEEDELVMSNNLENSFEDDNLECNYLNEDVNEKSTDDNSDNNLEISNLESEKEIIIGVEEYENSKNLKELMALSEENTSQLENIELLENDTANDNFTTAVENSNTNDINLTSDQLSALDYDINDSENTLQSPEIIIDEIETEVVKFRRTDQNDSRPPSSLERRKSRSLEAVTYLAIWKTDVEMIELQKGPKGLGFSILDYQDPLDPEGTVIVVRSLVPNSAADSDGRLKPGDRLMSVNGKSLKNVSLDDAVRALKGAPSGAVELGYSKPMPLPGREDDGIDDDFFIW